MADTTSLDGRTTSACNQRARRPHRHLRRWPTLLAVGLAALPGGADTTSFRELLILLAVEYLVMTVVGDRAVTWPVLLALTALYVALGFQDRVAPDAVLAVVAAIALAVGLGRRTEHRELMLQSAGVVLFGGLGLVVAFASAPTSTYLLAAGWLAHGAWDFVHLCRDKVVAPTYAEWCGVLDVLVAATLVATAT